MMSMKILKDDKETTLKKYNRSDLIYNRRYSFYKHINIENLTNFLLNQNIHIYTTFLI